MIDCGKIFFLGAGKMATALAGGMVKNGYPAAKVSAIDISAEAWESFEKTTGISSPTGNLSSNAKIAEALAFFGTSDVVVLAVKPQYLAEALQAYRGRLSDKLVISIVAGKNLATLAELTGAQRIIRVMPNTPAMVGCGASGFAGSDEVTAHDKEVARSILSAVGVCRELPEKLMDAVTGLSGSGPAFVFEFIQAMADGGVYAGLPRDTALQLAAQTVLGAARMVLESGLHPTVLRDQVNSPGGTTGRGLQVLDAAGFHGLVAAAVSAAAERSAELGKAK